MAGTYFPTGRYKLALVEPLIGDLFYFDLDKPAVNVGLSSGDCVLPLAAMGLTEFLEGMPASILERPIAQLHYNLGLDGAQWTLDGTHEVKANPDGEEPAVQKLVIKSGDVFQVHLPDNWGFFWFKLVDLVQEETAAAQQAGLKNETPGLEPTRL